MRPSSLRKTGLMIALTGVFFGLIIFAQEKALEASIARLKVLTLLNKVGVDDIDSDEEDIIVEFKELTPVKKLSKSIKGLIP